MKPNLTLILTALTLLCAGCVFPYPNTQTAVPSVHGRVVNAKTGEPVEYAGVAVDGHKETAVMTRKDGTFSTDSISRSSFFKVWNPLTGDPVTTVQLKVVRPGFEKYKDKVDWHSKTQSEVHLPEPVTLKPISKEELLGDVSGRDG
jgi:hypothetical protein